MSKLTLQQIADSLNPEFAGVVVSKDGSLCGYSEKPACNGHYFLITNRGTFCLLEGIDHSYTGNWEESWTPRTKQHKKLPMSHLWGMAVTWGSKTQISIVGDVREDSRKFSIHGIYCNVGEEDFIFTKDPTLPFDQWKSYEMLEEEYNK